MNNFPMYKETNTVKSSKNSKPLEKKKKSGIDAIMQQYDNMAKTNNAKFQKALKESEFVYNDNKKMNAKIFELRNKDFEQKHIEDLKQRQEYIIQKS